MSIVKWMVSYLGDNPRLCEFVKETNHFYIKSNKSRESKISRYHDFFDTEQEALDFIQSRKQREEENKRLKRIKDAAPELLDALVALVECKQTTPELWEAARAAIAKATA
ncbi:hypothetical protein [Pseudomonas aeruginosa]|uniref:hypothetical protein n=1 Tax=Pseudomonas aeruginosa TaxID=287 RepID=UPI000B8C60A0|nr:hypothetical protein [Pseudomonas aeruginosa]ASP07907.1 hypothetical protein CGU46_24525 [Pseudomonas aeruginosa]ASP15663.1 hypothetical protein CGU45_31550 [Pseudomonas aeruginosa]OZO07127.1 hypothetical protein CGU47_30900 [Pseudomonas aeruginosa]OZO15793.1 hypothetical protein CGU42_20600 [Pseudomonas aeruginosa]OZO39034.1 hypothetical protein CGU40_00575 [Pseudomonas aeruginosa]